MTLDLEQIQEVIHVHLNYKIQHGQESHKKSTTLNFSMEFHNKKYSNTGVNQEIYAIEIKRFLNKNGTKYILFLFPTGRDTT